MKYFFLFLSAIVFHSCNSGQNINSESPLTSIVTGSEIEYFNRIIQLFENQSEIGYYFYRQDSILNVKSNDLKSIIKEKGKIENSEQQKFIVYFENTLSKSEYIDHEKIDQLKSIKIQSVSEVDHLVHFFKFAYTIILQNSKVIPFDSFGTIASADSWEISKGENFTLKLALTASKNGRPLEWYRIKSGTEELNKDNIIDTLEVNELGQAFLATKKYSVGVNKMKFIVKLKMPQGERLLAQTINFTVK